MKKHQIIFKKNALECSVCGARKIGYYAKVWKLSSKRKPFCSGVHLKIKRRLLCILCKKECTKEFGFYNLQENGAVRLKYIHSKCIKKVSASFRDEKFGLSFPFAIYTKFNFSNGICKICRKKEGLAWKYWGDYYKVCFECMKTLIKSDALELLKII